MDTVRALNSKPRALGQLQELVAELQLKASSSSPLHADATMMLSARDHTPPRLQLVDALLKQWMSGSSP
eukprot:9317415-Pyramimonas_sp.AAC.1